MMQAELAALFRRDLGRLLQELRAFPDDETLWRTAPGVTNPAGNLVLHLEGNLREYIGRQLAGMEYRRDRPGEFAARGVTRAGLIARIEGLLRDIPPAIERLSDAVLDAPYPEEQPGGPQSARRFLLSLYGHFSYHLGQIGYLRRILTGGKPREAYE